MDLTLPSTLKSNLTQCLLRKNIHLWGKRKWAANPMAPIPHLCPWLDASSCFEYGREHNSFRLVVPVGFWWPQTCDGICFRSITQQAEKYTGRVKSCFPIGNKWKPDHAWVEKQQLYINNKTLIPLIRLKQMRHTFLASLNIPLAILWRLKMLMVLTSWYLYDC